MDRLKNKISQLTFFSFTRLFTFTKLFLFITFLSFKFRSVTVEKISDPDPAKWYGKEPSYSDQQHCFVFLSRYGTLS